MPSQAPRTHPDVARRARQAFVDTLAQAGYPAGELPAFAAMLEEMNTLLDRQHRGDLASEPDDAGRLAFLQRRLEQTLAKFERTRRGQPTLRVNR